MKVIRFDSYWNTTQRFEFMQCAGVLAEVFIAGKAIATGNPFMATCAALAVGFTIPGQIARVSDSVSRFCRRVGLNPIFLLGVIVGLLSFYFILDGGAAHAQFFNGAESWLKGALKGSDEIISLTFNVLRGLFLIYLGISLVQVIQKSRDGEDWQTLARTPMIILVTVTLGDVLAGMITGGGSSN